MGAGPVQLLWGDHPVGVITEVGWADFPWRGGRFRPAARLNKRIRAVLDWFAAQAAADRLDEPPFPTELLDGWAIAGPDGRRVALDGVPLVDLARGTIEWRE